MMGMKKMKRMKMKHSLEKMKKLGMKYSMKRMMMIFYVEKMVMADMMEMKVLTPRNKMIEKNRFLLSSLALLSLCMKLIQMGMKETN